MTTDDQRAAADRIAAEYSEQVRITPNAGPLRDLMVVAAPDGRTVVLRADGEPLADSRRGTVQDQAIVRGLQHAPLVRTQAGYDPSIDALLIEQPDEEWVVVPPWRCAMAAKEHLPLVAVEQRLREVRAWYHNVVDAESDLRCWELLAGETTLQRAE